MNDRIKWIYEDFFLHKCYISHKDGEKMAVDNEGRLIHDWMYVEYGVLKGKSRLKFIINRMLRCVGNILCMEV